MFNYFNKLVGRSKIMLLLSAIDHTNTMILIFDVFLSKYMV